MPDLARTIDSRDGKQVSIGQVGEKPEFPSNSEGFQRENKFGNALKTSNLRFLKKIFSQIGSDDYFGYHDPSSIPEQVN